MSITIKDISKDITERNRAYKHYVSVSDIYQDKNRKLYDELWDRLHEYPLFLIAYNDDAPIGMGGVNDFYWKQSNVARIMDRAYQFQRNLRFANRVTQYILKPQIDFCLENGIHTMFMSFEEERRMQQYQKHYLDKLEYPFELQPHRYNVCRQTENINCAESCWQGISVYHATDDRSFILPHK